MAFSGAFVKPFRPAFDAGGAAAAVVPSYLAGGAPTPIAVYQPKGAASLAASYVNLVNPGTYDAAPGIAPTLDASGWVFNGSTQYLTTGTVLGSMPGVAALILCSNAVADGNARTLFGLYDTVPPYGFFVAQLNGVSSMRSFDSGGATNFADNAPVITGGVYGIANLTAYRNGSAETNLIASSTASTPNQPLYIGALNVNGSALQHSICKVQAFVAWDTSTNHATWMPAVSAAMALI